MSEELDPKDIVRRGYDAISYRYRGDVEDASSQPYHGWLDELLPLLRPVSGGAVSGGAVSGGAVSGGAVSGERPRILDLGCGCGVPVARRLAKDYAVTGVDLSPVQIERARKLVPAAEFLCADMSALAFEPDHFDAVVAFYSIIHVPLAEQPGLLKKVYTWLKPGGLFMATLGHTAWTGTEDHWLGGGAQMYWSHTGEADYKAWLAAACFEIRWTRFIPEGNGGHLLVLAERPGG